MSVTTNIAVQREGRLVEVPGRLPRGLQSWWAAGRVTGDASGGNMTLNVQFNPSAVRDFAPYVSVDYMSAFAAVADPTDGEWVAIAGEFERNLVGAQSHPIVLGDGVTVPSSSSTWYVYNSHTVYLGRVRVGQVGTLRMRFPNVDTSVVDFYCAGLLADRPMVGLTDWKG